MAQIFRPQQNEREFVFQLEISENDSNKIVSPFDPSILKTLCVFWVKLKHGENLVLSCRILNARVLEKRPVYFYFMHFNPEYQKYAAPDEFYSRIRKLRPVLPKLEETVISSFRGTDISIANLLNSLAFPEDIKKINLYQFVTDLSHTCNALGRLTKLEELWLLGNNDPNFGRYHFYRKEDFQNLAVSLQGMKNLRTLSIQNWNIYEDPDESLGLLTCSVLYLKKNNGGKDIRFVFPSKGRQFVGDINNNDHFQNLDHFSDRTVDPDFYRNIVAGSEEPLFSLAKETAQLLGIIPENGKYNGDLKAWVQAMKTVPCRQEERAKHLHFFLSQLEPSQDLCDSIRYHSPAVVIQKNIRRYLVQRRLYKQFRQEVVAQSRRRALIPEAFFQDDDQMVTDI